MKRLKHPYVSLAVYVSARRSNAKRVPLHDAVRMIRLYVMYSLHETFAS